MLLAVDVVHTDLVVVPNAWVPVIIAIVIPIIVAAVSHATASDRVRTVVNIALTGVVSILTQLTVDGGDAVITWDTLKLWMLTAGVSILAYLGWKGLSNGTLNQRVLPDVGIGKAA